MTSRKDIESEQKNFEISTDINERRRFGQFFTPMDMAEEIAAFGLSLVNGDVHYLEPAFGMGAFYYAVEKLAEERLADAVGVEQDAHLYESAKHIWADSIIELREADFTTLPTDGSKKNLLITNPPYVRHHLLEASRKKALQKAVKHEMGLDISGLSGLYCYFLLLSDKWLSQGGVSGWLIPSEFMDVNYGKCVKEYLLNHVRLLRIHRYNPADCQFEDALVSSCVVWFRKEEPVGDYEVEFTYGGTHQNPELSRAIKKSALLSEDKWTRFPEKEIRENGKQRRLKEFFKIKRGLATGDNEFFIMTREQIEERNLDMSFFVPILPSPRHMRENEVFADTDNLPLIERPLFLLKCDLSEEEVKERHPSLWEYLQTGIESTSRKCLCRKRKQWFWQEKREATPFLCSYLGRAKGEGDKPFRFILNHSSAIATNTYLMLYPNGAIQERIDADPAFAKQIWECLCSISADDFESEGRVYGGGLRKIEPGELGNVYCKALERQVLDFSG